MDRVGCPWLIRKFVDRDAECVFVPGEKVMTEATRLDAIRYDIDRVLRDHDDRVPRQRLAMTAL